MLLSKVTQTHSLEKSNSTCDTNHLNEVEQRYQMVWFVLKTKHSLLAVATPTQALKKLHQSF